MMYRITVALLLLLHALCCFAALQTEQQNTLVQLYQATNGAQWRNNANWLSGDACANSWFGVSCDTPGENVVSISLSNNGLSGTVPSLSSLTALTRLQLSNNQLVGSLPASLGHLPSLTYVGLQNNQFTGWIPFAWSTMPAIQSLFLSNNQLSSGLQYLAQLNTLENLYLRSNMFTGTLGFLRTLTNLRILNAGSNSIGGQVPADISNLYMLYSISLINNNLTGSLPPSMTAMLSLTELYVSNNMLTGPLPNLPWLSDGSFQGNDFQCPVPSAAVYSSATCNVCAPGHEVVGQRCVLCPAGQVSDGTTPCTTCPSGTYTSLAGQSECSVCPSGTYTAGTGCESVVVLAQFILLVLIVVVVLVTVAAQYCLSKRFNKAFGHRMEPLRADL